ncbi:CLUMA_CG007644, isoform A [Clunio marinus]|uniref:CLUMA_CG007644, isoform A n=1 Tax=Clunio marinus TaxID=568069 RepID=A0A1J1I6S7_9DIPT|nr:CLUMA_CG007644, isoform A [Clunio marinus]
MRKKKGKKEISVVSYHPLYYWDSDIMELILQHLTPAELLTLSEASPDFFNYLLDCKQFRNCVKFGINTNANCFVSERAFGKFLAKLRRNYDALHLKKTDLVPKLPAIVRNMKMSVKELIVEDMTFNRPILMQKVINSVKDTVEKLVLKNILIFNCDNVVIMNLKHLKHLEMIDCNDNENAFVKRVSFQINFCKFLEYLKLHFAGVSAENTGTLLHENPNIKNLTLADIREPFFDDFKNIKNLKIEDFTITFSSSNRLRPKPYLVEFLEVHSSTLKHFNTNCYVNCDLLNFLFRLPNLETLRICRSLKFFIWMDSIEMKYRLKASKSLRELILTDDLTRHELIWTTLIENAPNLNHFQMYNSRYCSVERFCQ